MKQYCLRGHDTFVVGRVKRRCRECKRIVDRDYITAHREERTAYRAEHREEQAAYAAAYFQRHKDDPDFRQQQLDYQQWWRTTTAAGILKGVRDNARARGA